GHRYADGPGRVRARLVELVADGDCSFDPERLCPVGPAAGAKGARRRAGPRRRRPAPGGDGPVHRTGDLHVSAPAPNSGGVMVRLGPAVAVPGGPRPPARMA